MEDLEYNRRRGENCGMFQTGNRGRFSEAQRTRTFTCSVWCKLSQKQFRSPYQSPPYKLSIWGNERLIPLRSFFSPPLVFEHLSHPLWTKTLILSSHSETSCQVLFYPHTFTIWGNERLIPLQSFFLSPPWSLKISHTHSGLKH